MLKQVGLSESTSRSDSESPSLRVVETNPHSDAEWVGFVAKHPKASIYHHPLWLQSLEAEYGQKGLYLKCVDPCGHVLAILPLHYTQGLPFNLGGALTARRLSSLPRTPTAGPLSLDLQATTALLEVALQRISDNPGTQLQIKVRGPDLDGLVKGLPGKPWRTSYVLPLPGTSEGPYRVPDGKERAKILWAVKKAGRLGVVVRPARSEADLRNWYATYLETMRRNIIPPRPFRFFAALWNNLSGAGMMKLLLAEIPEAGASKVIAGSIFFMFGHTVSYAFSGMRRAYGSLRPNDAIQWHAINEACDNGFQLFDFGEVPEGHATLTKFKTKWGAQPVRLYRYVTSTDKPKSGTKVDAAYDRASLSRMLWQLVPLKLTAWVGDQIYRRL